MPLEGTGLLGSGCFAGVLDHVNDVLLITEAQPIDLPGPRVLFVNEAFERMTGYRRAEIIGRTPRLLQGKDTDPAARTRIRQHLVAWQGFRQRLLNYRHDGTPFSVELDVVPVADETGWFLYWVAVQRDVTEEQRRLEVEAQANRVQTIQALARGIAHDLNNRLALLAVGIEQLLEGVHSLERRQQIEEALQALQDTQTMTRQFFSLGRSTSSPSEGCRVVECLERALRLGTKGGDSVFHLEIEEPELLQVALSSAELERVVLNLLINAQQAVEAIGRRRTEVWVSARRVDREVVIRFRDNGPGVPSELGSRIFDAYHSTKRTGSGLGLAICARIMADAQGSIVLLPRHEDEQGATFELRAPLVPLSRSQPVDVVVLGPRILVVEDEPRLSGAWARRLSDEGYQVEVAATSQQARGMLAAGAFDLVISDLNLEYRCAGFDVLRDYLRQTPNGHYLLISGGDVKSEANAAGLAATVHDGAWLPKPFRMQELVDRVAELLAATERKAKG